MIGYSFDLFYENVFPACFFLSLGMFFCSLFFFCNYDSFVWDLTLILFNCSFSMKLVFLKLKNEVGFGKTCITSQSSLFCYFVWLAFWDILVLFPSTRLVALFLSFLCIVPTLLHFDFTPSNFSSVWAMVPEGILGGSV